MTTSGLVSVIVPTFNRARLCREAVVSALQQTYSKVEIIVVDDGSTDNTRALIENIDTRVRYVWQTNSGVTKARNVGIKNCRGEYVAFLDSDDLWFPWKLECQLAAFEQFPTAGMIWTDMEAVDANGKLIAPSYLTTMYHAYAHFDRSIHFNKQAFVSTFWKQCPDFVVDKKCYCGDIFDNMFFGNLVHTSTVLLRKDRQELVGGFREDLLVSGEDYDFHLRTCQFGDVAYIDVSSIQYRTGAEDQLTAPQHMVWMARNNLKTITAVLENKRPLGLSRAAIRKRLSGSHSWVGLEEFYDFRQSSRNHLLKSLMLNPFQKRTLLFFVLSFVPMPLLKGMRYIKQRIALLHRPHR